MKTNIIRNMAIAAAMLGAMPAWSAENGAYPRAFNRIEVERITYVPDFYGTVVGGGAVTTSGSGENLTLRHHDERFAQQPRTGMIPMTVGSGEAQTTVWVPADTPREKLALIGSDGSLPGGGSTPQTRSLAQR